MDDYYAILEVERAAAAEEIDQRIKSQLRTWTKRTSSPDLAKRQEAERRVGLLSDARKVLLDPARRAEYDRDLALRPSAAGPSTEKASGVSWLDEARRHLAGNDYLSGAYAARQARDADPGDPEAWSVLAWANRHMGKVDEALYEAGRAVQLAPEQAAYHYELAEIYAGLQRWDLALTAYEQAARLAPGLEEASVGIATALQQSGRHQEALALFERLYAQSANRAMMGFEFAFALLTGAEAVPMARSRGGYAVTSPQEIGAMRWHTWRARQVTSDPGLLRWADGIDRNLDWCAARHWSTPGWMRNGCLVVIMLGLVLLTLVGFFGAAAAGDAGALLGALLLGALVLGPIAVAAYISGYVPGWRLNQRVPPPPLIVTTMLWPR